MNRSYSRILAAFLLVLILAGCSLPPASSQNAPTGEKGQITETVVEVPPTEAEPTLPPTDTPQPTPTPEPEQITVQNAAQLAVAQETTLENSPFQIEWSMDSATFGIQKQDGLELLKSADLTVESSVVIDQPVFLLNYSAEGRRMATTADQTTAEVRDISTGNVLQTIQPDSMFTGAVFSPDGNTLALTSGSEIAVELWDVTEGERLQTLKGFETAAPVYNVKFSSNGQSLIWWARAGVQVMSIASGQLGPRLSHEDFVSALELSPNGQILAAATAGTLDGEFMPFIQLWDPNSGQALGELKTGQQIPYSISFSPDGSLLAAGTDAIILIWNVAEKEQIAALTNSSARINAVAFSPDGTTLASSSEDGKVMLWQIPR